MFVYKVSDILKFSNICVDMYLSHNSSDFVSGTNETSYAIYTRHGGVKIFMRIGIFIVYENKCNTDDSRMKGYFC